MRTVPRGCATVIGTALLLVAGCSTKSESEKEDDRSLLACRNFRGVAADYKVLTASELRDRLLDVREDAQGVATERVQAAATEMVMAASPFDDDRLGAAVLEMGDACKATGN